MSEQEKTKICPFCGERITEDTETCPFCNENLTELQKEHKSSIKCKNCGMYIDEKMAICPYCGSMPRLSNSKFYFIVREKNIYSTILLIITLLLFSIDINLFIDAGKLNGWLNFVIILLSLLLSILYVDKIKNFIVLFGRKVIDISMGLCLLVTLGILVTGIVLSCHNATKEFVEFWWFLLFAIIYLIITVTSNYILYILIDMNDHLKNIDKNLLNKK